ncbi:MAG: zinc ribbon domain-containing protein [Dethiosulfatibacter sp.]|nr:zinc ribbon domain-containing protein [Dethiosulfatibacter sp.]
MSDFFGKFKKGLDKSISIASQKSGELMEAGKLQTQIISLRNDKKNAINELGKITYDMLKSESFELEVLEGKFQEILQIEKELEEKEEAKNKEETKEANKEESKSETYVSDEAHVICPNCGAENPLSAMFCGKCGTKLKE